MEYLSNWIGWIVALIATFFALRATVHFDVNEWLKDRRKHREENLRRLCPHVRTTLEDGKPAVQSTYISPPGTRAWQCQQCGHVTHDEEAIEQCSQYWANNPNELIENSKKMKKLAKKLGRL